MPGYDARPIDWLIEPLSRARFFDEHWGKRFAFSAGRPCRLLDVYDLASWRARRALRDVKASRRTDSGVQEQLRIEPGAIETALSSGMTVCADVSGDPSVARFLDAFQGALRLAGGAPFAKLYASNHGGGFDLHTDAHHVFVLQIAGSKRWRVSSAPAVESPPCGAHLNEAGAVVCNAPRDGELALSDLGVPLAAPSPAELEAVLLQEGDVLYLPPGTWHGTEAVGQSIALSISPPRATVFSVMMRALEDVLMQQPAWRREVLVPLDEQAPPGRVPPSVEKAFADRAEELRELLGVIDPRVFHRVWRLNVRCADGGWAGSSGDAAQESASPPIARGERLVVVPSSIEFLVAPSPEGAGNDGERVFFYHHASEWSLPAEALPFMTELAARREFTADTALTWDRTLTWEALRDVLSQLVEAAILRRVG